MWDDRQPRRSARVRIAGAVAGLLIAAAPQTALAQVDVYHSERDDGFASGPAAVLGHDHRPRLLPLQRRGRRPERRRGVRGGHRQQRRDLPVGGPARARPAISRSSTWPGGRTPSRTTSPSRPRPSATARAATPSWASSARRSSPPSRSREPRGSCGSSRPSSPMRPAHFGFVDKQGAIQTVAASGVLLAAAPSMRWQALSSATGQACGALANGELQCWGTVTGTPPSGAAYRQVATGDGFGCALDYDDAISCWGNPLTPPSSEYLRIAAGPTDVCGLTPALDIECFGGSGPDRADRPLSAGLARERLRLRAAARRERRVLGNRFRDARGRGRTQDLAGGGDHVCALLDRRPGRVLGRHRHRLCFGLPHRRSRSSRSPRAPTTPAAFARPTRASPCWGATPPAGIPDRELHSDLRSARLRVRHHHRRRRGVLGNPPRRCRRAGAPRPADRGGREPHLPDPHGQDARLLGLGRRDVGHSGR